MKSATDIALDPVSDQEDSAADSRVIISREGEQALKRELAELIEQRDVHLPRRLANMREYGAGSENDEYLQLLEEEAVQAAKIDSIRQILSRARVVDSAEGPDGIVQIGSVVTLRVSGKEMKRQVRGAHEPLGSDGVSAASPIGNAILGRAPGDKVEAELPNGSVVKIEIVTVELGEPAVTAA